MPARLHAPFSGARATELRDAERSRPFRWLVRTGFWARGVTYGVIGALAIALACGAGTDGTAPDQQGALALVARAPLGFLALIVIVAGLLAYAIWKFTQAIRGHGPEGGGGLSAFDRLANGAGGVAYLVFCAVALRIVVGGGGSKGSSAAPRRAASGVLGWPAGPWLVGAAGVGLVAVSAYQAYDALAGRFTAQIKMGEMDRSERQMFCALGRIGLVTRALVFAVCGYFLARTAVTFDPGSAVGVDGALARLHQQPWGPWIVGFVGVGLLVFAGFSLYEGRYRRL